MIKILFEMRSTIFSASLLTASLCDCLSYGPKKEEVAHIRRGAQDDEDTVYYWTSTLGAWTSTMTEYYTFSTNVMRYSTSSFTSEDSWVFTDDGGDDGESSTSSSIPSSTLFVPKSTPVPVLSTSSHFRTSLISTEKLPSHTSSTQLFTSSLSTLYSCSSCSPSTLAPSSSSFSTSTSISSPSSSSIPDVLSSSSPAPSSVTGLFSSSKLRSASRNVVSSSPLTAISCGCTDQVVEKTLTLVQPTTMRVSEKDIEYTSPTVLTIRETPSTCFPSSSNSKTSSATRCTGQMTVETHKVSSPTTTIILEKTFTVSFPTVLEVTAHPLYCTQWSIPSLSSKSASLSIESTSLVTLHHPSTIRLSSKLVFSKAQDHTTTSLPSIASQSPSHTILNVRETSIQVLSIPRSQISTTLTPTLTSNTISLSRTYWSSPSFSSLDSSSSCVGETCTVDMSTLSSPISPSAYITHTPIVISTNNVPPNERREKTASDDTSNTLNNPGTGSSNLFTSRAVTKTVPVATEDTTQTSAAVTNSTVTLTTSPTSAIFASSSLSFTTSGVPQVSQPSSPGLAESPGISIPSLVNTGTRNSLPSSSSIIVGIAFNLMFQ